MPLLDATNDTIDYGDVGSNAAATGSDSNHWTILCDLPASGAPTPGVVIDNKTSLVGLTKLLSVRHGGLETGFIRQDGSIGVGTGGLFPTLSASFLSLRGQIGDGAGAIAVRIANTAALTVAGAKIIQFFSDNFITEKAYIDLFGSVNAGSFDAFQAGGTAQARGKAADGAGAIGVKIGNTQALANASAKIASFYSDNLTTEKLAVSNTGKLVVPTGGAAAVAGQAVLVAGTVTVATTSVATASLVFLTRGVAGGTTGDLRVGAIVNGTSFVISSLSGTDTSTVNWFLIN